MIVGLIPARGGSKGIPRKNLALVGGTSLLARGISLLKNSGCDRVYVSSEDEEILTAADRCGASQVVRPLELSSDSTSTESVMLDAINQLNLKYDDLLITHQLTSPFLQKESVIKCIEALNQNLVLNSAFVGVLHHSFQWQEMPNGFWEPLGHSREYRPRRQELPNVLIESGGVYAARVSKILEFESRFPAPSLGIAISFLESLDIDTPEDLASARSIIQGVKNNEF